MSAEQRNSAHHDYGQPAWVNTSAGYSASPQLSMSPMQEIAPFEYQPSAALPLEPAYAMPRSEAFATTQPPMPPPLIMPHNQLWPSMLTSAPTMVEHGYQAPMLPNAPIQTPLSASTASDVTPTSAKTASAARRKLTDDERRQMCIEAQQNPTMKQTQIGAKFNVERSTVSKILRQREKYMNPQPKEEIGSPGKKSKAKLPDFEKTLTNWVKNQQKKGVPVTDEDLRKQAQVFSFSRSDQAVVSSTSWLEKFKRKNSLGLAKKDGDSSLGESSAPSLAEASISNSPLSSDGIVSPPIAAIDELSDGRVRVDPAELLAFEDEKNLFGPPEMLGDGSHQTGESAFVLGLQEPMGVGLAEMAIVDEPAHAPEPRQRTLFPNISPVIGISPHPSTQHTAPVLPFRSLTNSVAEPRPTAVDPRQVMKRHKSVPDIHYPEQVRFSSMQPPPLPKSADTSPVSNPASPAEDDNIKALHNIKALLQQNPNVAEPDDYLAIGKLMEKLKLIRPAPPNLPGGMHPIEMAESPRISKKRTILGIST